MEYSPPPLFKQGAPARVKVTVFALLSIALLVVDARLHALTAVRQVAATVLYPFQMAALMPRDALANMGTYFSSISALQKEVRDLKSQQVAMAQAMQQAQLQMAENTQLRRLMDAREHLPVRSQMSEILYDARDPSTRRVVLDRGTRNGVKLGLPVIDNAGVVGQVTRVFPFTSEVTLLTDKEQAIPVQVLRNGLRSVAYGRGQSGLLDLRFVAPNADIQVGDVLVTSGLDGVYPAGLAVAKVIQVENVVQGAFGRVVCQPLAGIDRYRQLLIVMSDQPLPPRPPAEPVKAATSAASKKNLPRMEPVPPLPLPPQPLAPAVAPAANAANAANGARPAAPHANAAARAPAPAPAPAPARATPGAATGAPAAGTPAATAPVARPPAPPAARTATTAAPAATTVARQPAAGTGAAARQPAAAAPAQGAAAAPAANAAARPKEGN
ncbi:rod shape-determining protein MreC [Massilia sp. Root335]|uniref:rod shape-determining protein MreC n=1 Tax=Massilia sp. Root335 TaxID=1736517 RepID=UPI0006FA9247|nr:rod shape-determining protein MreC [Massilia sp. Root335]KQV35481.1 rod shape-determining protein MreC [Massilia sp. Root335]